MDFNHRFSALNLSSISEQYQKVMLKHVYSKLRSLSAEYSNFKHWYDTKVCNQLGEKREIIVALCEDEIAGIVIVKRADEKKICTLRVFDKFQRIGLGRSLMEKSFEYLDTEKPLITVSSIRSIQFKRLFEYYNFKQEGLYYNKYNSKANELSFNGILIEQHEPVQGNLFNEQNLMFLKNETIDHNIFNIEDYEEENGVLRKKDREGKYHNTTQLELDVQ